MPTIDIEQELECTITSGELTLCSDSRREVLTLNTDCLTASQVATLVWLCNHDSGTDLDLSLKVTP